MLTDSRRHENHPGVALLADYGLHLGTDYYYVQGPITRRGYQLITTMYYGTIVQYPRPNVLVVLEASQPNICPHGEITNSTQEFFSNNFERGTSIIQANSQPPLTHLPPESDLSHATSLPPLPRMVWR